MQDFSTGNGWEVKQVMKFSVHNHKAEQKGKHASKFKYASTSELVLSLTRNSKILE